MARKARVMTLQHGHKIMWANLAEKAILLRERRVAHVFRNCGDESTRGFQGALAVGL